MLLIGLWKNYSLEWGFDIMAECEFILVVGDNIIRFDACIMATIFLVGEHMFVVFLFNWWDCLTARGSIVELNWVEKKVWDPVWKYMKRGLHRVEEQWLHGCGTVIVKFHKREQFLNPMVVG